MQVIIVSELQNMMDVALQNTGSLEATFDLAVLNNISVTEDLAAGSDMFYETVVNKAVVAAFNTKPATRDVAPQLLPGGIGYMQIMTDFIVS